MFNRPYQERALAEVRAHWAAGRKRVLLSMPTGAGKTHVFCQLAGPGTIIVVRGIKLIHQASARLTAMGIAHGIYQGSNTRDTCQRVMVASIDTLARRSVDLSGFDTLIIDEAHLTEGKAYERLLSQWQGRVLAVTATPWLRRGMGHVAECLVEPVTMTELVAMGSLVPLRYFAVAVPNMKGVPRIGGDFSQDIAAERVSLAGCPVDKYAEHGEERQGIVFCSTIAHAQAVTAKFQASGITAETIHAETPDSDRERAFAAFNSGALRLLVSVGVLTTGVDLPCASVIVMARATTSRILWVQMLGRGTRTHEGKRDCIVLDLAGNTLRLGFATDPQPVLLARLDKAKAKPKGETLPLKTCKRCYAVVPSAAADCPNCKAPFPVARKPPRIKVSCLSEITPGEFTPTEHVVKDMVDLAKARRWKKGAVWHRLVEKYGKDLGKVLYFKYVYREPWPDPIPNPSRPWPTS